MTDSAPEIRENSLDVVGDTALVTCIRRPDDSWTVSSVTGGTYFGRELEGDSKCVYIPLDRKTALEVALDAVRYLDERHHRTEEFRKFDQALAERQKNIVIKGRQRSLGLVKAETTGGRT